MKIKKFELGKLYKVTFLDHSIGMHEKMICQIVGWCIRDEAEHAVFTSWVVVTKDEQVKKDNVEPVSILKAVVTSVRKI
jgi:hypothetical protein